jgi:hypothetical protein
MRDLTPSLGMPRQGSVTHAYAAASVEDRCERPPPSFISLPHDKLAALAHTLYNRVCALPALRLWALLRATH